MILYKKTKTEFLSGFINGKNFLVGLMVATFMVFASGTGTFNEGGDVLSIVVGAGLFTLGAGVLIWAGDISKKLYS
ncbi:MAG: hypothetical protein HOH18_01375 [Kordiimonadaceae bacterium]|nr:hypothetical protein [Kordiimonadaceae bacterium]MBT6035102.1 hypothetical protein [Kordiimonadaceae bacterium]